jgi:gas vesicle protein
VSEQSTGFGPFLFGVVIGAALGFLFAPEAGAASRTRLARRVRELAAEKLDQLGELAGAGDADDAGDAEAPPLPARAALARRLSDAKRRRRVARRGGGTVKEEDEPVA